jgi:hypothetical protein
MAKAKYSVTLNRDIVTTIGHLVVMSVTTGKETIIAPPTSFVQTAGPRSFQTKKRALGFVAAQRATHGQDVCSDVTTI